VAQRFPLETPGSQNPGSNGVEVFDVDGDGNVDFTAEGNAEDHTRSPH
jgi:hypothetical protein